MPTLRDRALRPRVRRLSVPCPHEKVSDCHGVERSGIPIGCRHGGLDRAFDAALRHAELAQGALGPKPAREIEECFRSIASAKPPCGPRHGLSRSRRVVGGGMGEQHAMRLRMRQVEGASENMAELVMQGHAHHAENLAA